MREDLQNLQSRLDRVLQTRCLLAEAERASLKCHGALCLRTRLHQGTKLCNLDGLVRIREVLAVLHFLLREDNTSHRMNKV